MKKENVKLNLNLSVHLQFKFLKINTCFFFIYSKTLFQSFPNETTKIVSSGSQDNIRPERNLAFEFGDRTAE